MAGIFGDIFGIGQASRNATQLQAAREANQTQLNIVRMLLQQQMQQTQLTARAQVATAQSAERIALAQGQFDAMEADAARTFQANQDTLRFNFAEDQLSAQTGLAQDQLANQREAVQLQTSVQQQALQNQNTLNLLQQATRRDTLRFIASGDVSAFTSDEGRVIDEALASSRASRGIIFTDENMRDSLRERQGDLIRRAGVARAVGQSFNQATQVDRALGQSTRQNVAQVAMGTISAAAAAAATASRNSGTQALQQSRMQAAPLMPLVDTSAGIMRVANQARQAAMS